MKKSEKMRQLMDKIEKQAQKPASKTRTKPKKSVEDTSLDFNKDGKTDEKDLSFLEKASQKVKKAIKKKKKD